MNEKRLVGCYAQAAAAKGALQKLKGLQDALWVVSPLQRTIETFLLACPFSSQLQAGAELDGRIPCGRRRPTVVLHPCVRTSLLGARLGPQRLGPAFRAYKCNVQD